MAALPALRALPARHTASLAALPPSALLLGPLPRADHFDPPPVATFADLPAAGARACDNCAASASVFCRADAALLCPACDVAVHSANRLAGRHFRVPLPPPLPAPHARRHAPAPAPALTLSMLHGPADLALALQAGACIEREAASLALSSGAALSDACRIAAPAGENALPDEEEETPELSAESAASMCSVHTTVSAAENAATQQAVAAFYARRKRLRAEALARFRAKRAKRSFAKKVRYECRKTLADQRPRVKGRFVNKNELGLYRKYGDNYHLFLHELADGGGTDNSAGSSILSDTPNSPGAQHAADEALYNAL